MVTPYKSGQVAAMNGLGLKKYTREREKTRGFFSLTHGHLAAGATGLWRIFFGLQRGGVPLIGLMYPDSTPKGVRRLTSAAGKKIRISLFSQTG